MHASSTPARTGALPLRLRSFLASAGLVVLACLAYRHMPGAMHLAQFGELYGVGSFRFTGTQYMVAAALAYITALGLFHAGEPLGLPSKALKAWWVLGRFAKAPVSTWRAGLSADDRLAVLASLLKSFFGPMMVMSALGFANATVQHAIALVEGGPASGAGFLHGPGFWFLLRLIVLVDVAVFTVGYLVELPRLNNQIRSVDPSPWGWAAALACYPPLNIVTLYIIGGTATEFPQFENETVHNAMNVLGLACMATYSWASLALGWKGSNLTHRGIVARGPYRFVRHPAYAAKNLAWWIGSVPVISAGFAQSPSAGLAAFVSMASWTGIYVLRALTEEDHLRRVDGDYAAYAARVRWRFVPGVV